MPHVSGCVALAQDGEAIPSRYKELHPEETYGAGFLQLSVQDVLQAAGLREVLLLPLMLLLLLLVLLTILDSQGLNGKGAEGQPIRLSGLELAAYIDVRNYATPFLWPAKHWGARIVTALGLTRASDIGCTIRFEVLRLLLLLLLLLLMRLLLLLLLLRLLLLTLLLAGASQRLHAGALVLQRYIADGAAARRPLDDHRQWLYWAFLCCQRVRVDRARFWRLRPRAVAP